ncbi:PQQ-dependent sugar dehydrogenase [Alteromonas pelagimontana]|uniref:PQQ-dependent sugar dehydrogenase n=2 Tax=Alteromonas pelagimontana TaxID=1858656 RepID=A0A6M4MHY8_9ALTE|nr:PQQ-dependent sugar dehydrogenase [Alteromonas pelagimontana]
MFLLLLLPLAVAAQEDYQVSKVVENLHDPWTMVELPDGRWVVTEMSGSLVFVGKDGQLNRQQLDLPQLYVAGQGGLLDIALTQDYSMSHRVLFSFAQGNADNNRLAVATARLEEDQLKDIKLILAVEPMKGTPVHFGGRLAVLNDGTWLVTVGDGFDYREQAQLRHSQLGKILRFREDGRAPVDNPFPDAPYVYSYGHRNPQGLVVDEENGRIIEHEHGPDGGDEINIIEAGENYGWPVITQGLDYSGAKISPFTQYADMRQPVVDWTPSIAPSGMTLYTNVLFSALRDQLLVSTLKNEAVYAVNLSATPPVTTRIFATIKQRLRDVAVGQDGAVYILTNGHKAALLKVQPK